MAESVIQVVIATHFGIVKSASNMSSQLQVTVTRANAWSGSLKLCHQALEEELDASICLS